MKIAFLITAYNNYEHLERLIKSVDQKEVTFFIHIDKKAYMPTNLYKFNNIIFIPRIKVWWGGWSHQEAINNLIKKAVAIKSDYYILISGTDYPIRPAEFLYEKLRSGGQYINLIEGFQAHKPEWRVKYYYFDCFDRRKNKSVKTYLFKNIEDIRKKIITKENYPFSKIYHGSTWWALNFHCISYILNFIQENPKYVKFFKSCWCPEEAFIPTIVGNSHFLSECKNNITYADWTTNPAPAIINEMHLQLFKKQIEFTSSYGTYKPFFARKFNDGSTAIVEKIENELR